MLSFKNIQNNIFKFLLHWLLLIVIWKKIKLNPMKIKPKVLFLSNTNTPIEHKRDINAIILKSKFLLYFICLNIINIIFRLVAIYSHLTTQANQTFPNIPKSHQQTFKIKIISILFFNIY